MLDEPGEYLSARLLTGKVIYLVLGPLQAKLQGELIEQPYSPAA